MDDTRETLRRGIGDFAPGPGGYERVVRRLARKRRRQRITAAAVAIAIVLTGTALFARAFTRDRVPLGGGPTPLLSSGSAIAYSAPVGSQTRETPEDIFLLVPGEAPRRIIGADGDRISQTCPAFSPDGTRLAYQEVQGGLAAQGESAGTVRVVGVDANGTPTGDQGAVMDGVNPWSACPAWSPDGNRIAMVRGRDEIAVTALGEGPSNARRSFHLSDQGLDGSVAGFAWSPDGSTIAAIFGRTVWIIPADGRGDPSVVYRLSGQGGLEALAWSPDGSRLVIGGSTGPQGSCCAHRRPLLEIVDVPTGSTSAIPMEGPKGWAGIDLGGLTWLPQDRIAVTEYPGGIALVDPRGSSTVLRLRYAGEATGVSPDGRLVAYTAYNGADQYAVVAQPIDGSSPTVLTPWSGQLEFAGGYTWRPALG